MNLLVTCSCLLSKFKQISKAIRVIIKDSHLMRILVLNFSNVVFICSKFFLMKLDVCCIQQIFEARPDIQLHNSSPNICWNNGSNILQCTHDLFYITLTYKSVNVALAKNLVTDLENSVQQLLTGNWTWHLKSQVSFPVKKKSYNNNKHFLQKSICLNKIYF